jgi:hypothetical protein
MYHGLTYAITVEVDFSSPSRPCNGLGTMAETRPALQSDCTMLCVCAAGSSFAGSAFACAACPALATISTLITVITGVPSTFTFSAGIRFMASAIIGPRSYKLILPGSWP